MNGSLSELCSWEADSGMEINSRTYPGVPWGPVESREGRAGLGRGGS